MGLWCRDDEADAVTTVPRLWRRHRGSASGSRQPRRDNERVAYRHLRRPHGICVCIDNPAVASNYVVISGTAACRDQDIRDEARRITARYRAPGEVDDSLARWQTEPRGLVTVTPERLATRATGRR